MANETTTPVKQPTPQTEAASNLKAAQQLLIDTKEQLKGLLSDPLNQAIAANMEHQFNQLINRLHFMGGATPVSIQETTFQPITNFMGEDINRPVQVTKDTLTPDQAQQQDYTNKVDRLYDHIESMFPDKVLNSYTIPEDVLVLRGVAKKAGVADYQTAKLNIPFVEAIQKGIKDKRTDLATKAQFEANLINAEKENIKGPGITEGPGAGASSGTKVITQTPDTTKKK